MSVVDFPLEVERLRYPEIDSFSEIGSIKSEEDKHPKASSIDDYLYVAVGKSVKENRSTVIWALQNSGGKKICILHIHTPAQMIPFMGGKLPLSQVGKQEIIAYHEREKNEMLKSLDEYVQLCAKAGVNAEKLYIEADSIENGIITLISQNMIRRLVMGASADNRHKKGMTQLKSKKAIYIQSQAPSFCHIWFVCKGDLILTREGVNPQYTNHETAETNSLRSQPRTETEQFDTRSFIHQNKNKSRTFEAGGYNHDTDDRRMSDGSSSESERFSRLSVFDSARPSTSSVVFRGSPLSHGSDIPQRTRELVLTAPFIDNAYVSSPSPSCILQERSMGDGLYDKYDKLMVEADNLREEVYLESTKRQKAEKETIDATRKVKTLEFLYYEEQKRRKELEEKLLKETRELETIKNQHAKVLEEFRVVLLQKSSLEREIEKSNLMVEELDDKIFSAVGLLEKYKKDRDDLEIELDNALLETELLRRQLARVEPMTSVQVSKFFADFTYIEILEATDNFNPSWKIGEGGFGDTYKGLLHHVEVAIKVPGSDSLQGRQEFQREVDALSKLRHPNIVTLIGVCSEASALIYEYLPNGNLDDRLICKDNTPPLSWQTRLSIATELCSVLMFLHSNQPESIIHGDLKPSNVLLDANLSCKLSDFGICRKLYNAQGPMESMTRFYKTDPKGTFAYMDPEFLSSGELTLKSDVYSFGIILLRLLTGKTELGLIKDVQDALDMDNLNSILDTSAGDWPFVQAKQLALLGLRCCEMQRKNRANIEEDVWRVLEPMRVSSGSFTSANLGLDEYDHVPSYFMCPIFQEVMQDPHIATDGFTYEAEALRGWLDSGHDTSPMTNLKLQNHTLIPNRGLRSAIQEWLQRRRIQI